MQAMQFLNQQVPKQRRGWVPGMMPEEGEQQRSFGSHEFNCEVGQLPHPCLTLFNNSPSGDSQLHCLG